LNHGLLEDKILVSFSFMVFDTLFVNSSGLVQNFVDLAGSERVAQTHAKGKTLEEGCHINKSLLTLTTVIRKLRYLVILIIIA
jgi:Kinesin motor domain